MGFRLATVDGRAVLIHGAAWHDLAAASDGSFSGDPMEAIDRHAELLREVGGDRVDIAAEARKVLPPDLRADGFSNTAYNLTVDLEHVQAC